MLTNDAIQSALSTEWLGRQFLYLPSVPSTNDVLKEMAEANAPAGTMVLADFQSSGKGRLNRHWEAPPESSLLVSLLFRPNWPPEHTNWLMMIAGLAAVSAVHQETGLSPSLKWPNDLVHNIEGRWYKFGGLLLEAGFEQELLTYAILGSGINVNIPPEELPEAATPATSLLAILGHEVDRLSLLNYFLAELEKLYDAADQGHSPWEAWEELLVNRGQPIQATGLNFPAPLEGTAEGVDEWGRLLVRDKDGRLHILAAGDVSLRG
jgi:BirA family transcriptional regulator, biotin operon repressor / biotin---[acetyl-CoA-carboxylase] ligase